MSPSRSGTAGRGRQPHADRPDLPGYGIRPAASPDDLLPWSWAVERLERARNYWVATTNADGSPHLAAVWGLWLDDAFWFSTGGRSRKARNLARNPRCSVAPESAAESVVVSGHVSRVGAVRPLQRLDTAYRAKYGEGFPDPARDPVFRVVPERVIGIIEVEPGFSERATRWTFDVP